MPRTRAAAARSLAVRACGIRGCRRAHKARGLCHRHGAPGGTRADRTSAPGPGGPSTSRRSAGTARSRLRQAGLPSGGPTGRLRVLPWPRLRSGRLAGRPAVAAWLAELAHCGDPRVEFRGLARNVRLELQFGLQCRHDEGDQADSRPGCRPGRDPGPASRGCSSLLDLTDGQWQDRLKAARRAGLGRWPRRSSSTPAAPAPAPGRRRPVGRPVPSRHLGPAAAGHHRGRNPLPAASTAVPQPWLRDLAKRWCRWRLSRGLAADDRPPATCAPASSLAAPPARRSRTRRADPRAAGSMAGRAAARERPHPSTDPADHLGRCLPARRPPPRLGAGAAPGALIYHDDAPRKAPRNPRWIPEHLMRQMEAPEAPGPVPLRRRPGAGADPHRLRAAAERRPHPAAGLRHPRQRRRPLPGLAQPQDARPGRVLPDQRGPRRRRSPGSSSASATAYPDSALAVPRPQGQPRRRAGRPPTAASATTWRPGWTRSSSPTSTASRPESPRTSSGTPWAPG